MPACGPFTSLALGAEPVQVELEGEGSFEIASVALNPLDLSVAAGRFAGGHPPLPYVPGCEAVGRRNGSSRRLREAAASYAEVAECWREFGDVPERAFALLGHGRSLRAIGDQGAERPLREARELFASMSFAPALAEVDGLLGSPEAAAL